MTATILHTSDTHWSEAGRLDDVRAVHTAMLELAHDRKIDLWVHAGDFFDRRSTPVERRALATWLQEAAEIAPVWGCKGNHDVAGDLAIFNMLETVHPVWIEERATSTPGSAPTWELDDGRKIGLLALSWIDKANFVAGLAPTMDSEQTRQGAIEAVRELLTCLRAEAARLRSMGAVPIMATHVMLGGSVVSTGQMLIGQGIELSPSDLLDIGAAYVACGHIHAHQRWFDGRVAYCGSPSRHTFGEHEPKGCCIVTIDDDGAFSSNEFVELPARRIVRLEADWADEAGAEKLRAVGINSSCFALGCRDEVHGALVRFRYRVRPSDLHLVNKELIASIFRADGATEVQLEAVVVQETRARVPEIVESCSVGEKLDRYLEAKGIALEEKHHERLHERLGILEGALQ